MMVAPSPPPLLPGQEPDEWPSYFCDMYIAMESRSVCPLEGYCYGNCYSLLGLPPPLPGQARQQYLEWARQYLLDSALRPPEPEREIESDPVFDDTLDGIRVYAARERSFIDTPVVPLERQEYPVYSYKHAGKEKERKRRVKVIRHKVVSLVINGFNIYH